jgi:competence protein ComEA
MRTLATLFLTLILSAVAPALLAEPLDINSATAEQLDATLTGVGKVKAQAIVQDRDKNGKFKSVDELERVKGIGPATIEKNRSKLTVGGEPVAAAAPSPATAAQPAPPPPAAPPSGAPAKAK